MNNKAVTLYTSSTEPSPAMPCRPGPLTRRFGLTAVCVAAVVALTACQQTRGPYLPIYTTPDLENHAEVVMMDPHVQQAVIVSGAPDKQLTPDGRLKALVNVRNRLERRVEVQVSCVFKSPDGFSTGDETPWKTLILTENAQETLSFEATNKDAKKFTIRVRRVH